MRRTMKRLRNGRTRDPRNRRWIPFLILGLLILTTGCGTTFPVFNPVSSQGTTIYNQFLVVLGLSGIVFLIVFGLLGWILLKYRGKDDDDEPYQRAGNTKLEFTWIAIPVLMLTALAIYSGVTMKAVEASSSNALQINVIGHQWWWEFQYPSYGIDTAGELYLPVGTPIKLNITSADVIHSFWVPDLGWKQDAFPNKINVMNLNITKAGTYDGFCAEFCGEEHAWMRIRVVNETKANFDTWVAQQRTPPPAPTTALEKQGEQIFTSNTCVNCHVLSRVGPSLTHFGSRSWIGSGVLTNTPQNLAKWIDNAQQVKPGVHMPSFRFSQDQLNALVAYLEGQK